MNVWVSVEVSSKLGANTALGGIDSYSTSADSCLKGAIGCDVEYSSECVHTIRNKNGALPDIVLPMTILGTCSGMLVGMMCGPKEVEPMCAGESTGEAANGSVANGLEGNVVAEVKACEEASVPMGCPLTHNQQGDRVVEGVRLRAVCLVATLKVRLRTVVCWKMVWLLGAGGRASSVVDALLCLSVPSPVNRPLRSVSGVAFCLTVISRRAWLVLLFRSAWLILSVLNGRLMVLPGSRKVRVKLSRCC